jgi:hypothetical protein
MIKSKSCQEKSVDVIVLGLDLLTKTAKDATVTKIEYCREKKGNRLPAVY